MIKISIIIVTYNSQTLLDDCLQSILNSIDVAPSQVEVIVVDNSSGSNAIEIKSIVENHSLTQTIETIYIHNTTNLGYGQGNNIGIQKSSGDIICIMNPDVRFESPVLKEVSENFKNQKLALLSYKQLGGYNLSFYLKPEYNASFLNAPIVKIMNKLDFFKSKYFYLSGAFFFVDKSKFEEVGCFDENIFMYYEEPDVANRLQNRGYEIKYCKNKTYHHLVGKRNTWSEKSFQSEINSLMYYLEKYKINKKRQIRFLLFDRQIKLFLSNFFKDTDRQDKLKNEIDLLKKNIL